MFRNILFCVSFITFSLCLTAMQAPQGSSIFNMEMTANGGLKITAPQVKHPDFALNETALEQVLIRLINCPTNLHDMCVMTIESVFEAAGECNDALVAAMQSKMPQIYFAAWKDMYRISVAAHQACPLAFMQECTGDGIIGCPHTRTAIKQTAPAKILFNRLRQSCL